MRDVPLLLLVAILTNIEATQIASAGETVVLRAGEAMGPNAVFAFDKKAKPRAIVVRTTQVGVAGSRFEISVDTAEKPVFSHIFTAEECKFGNDDSKCEVAVSASSSASHSQDLKTEYSAR